MNVYSRTYTNVYIGIRSKCMYKDHLNITAFNKVRVAQSEEHRTSDLRVMGSNPTVGKNVSFVFCRFRRAPAVRLVPYK